MKKKDSPNVARNGLQRKVDALVEFVHRGCAPMLDVSEVLSLISPALKPNCCANYEYRFTWNDDCDPDSLDIDWKRLRKRVLQRVVKKPERVEKILAGARMSAKEKQAYRLEFARTVYGYRTAEERLDSNDNCKWVDLSYVTDSKGRSIYLLEMADANTTTDEDMEAKTPEEFVEWHENLWQWKQQPLGVFGPFRSVEEAEEWMSQKGAFEDE